MTSDLLLYYDGRTARAQPVTPEPDADGLALFDDYRRLVAYWPYANIRLVDRPGDGQPVRLKNRPGGRERLTLPDSASLARLAAHCPDLYDRENSWRGHGRRALIWGTMAVASIVFMVAVAIPRIAIHMATNLPPNLETLIGVAAEEQVIKALALAEKKPADVEALTCTAARGNAHLNRIINRFTDQLNDPAPVSLRVVDLDIVNALALPGRRILVFRGLIEALNHPNELAGILGHELAHVHYRHATELLLRETGYGVLLGLVFGDITGGSVLGGAARIATGAAYGRQAEALSDQLAVQLMNGAGWDVRPMARFFRRLDGEQGDTETLIGMFMTHPLSRARADAIFNTATARGAALDRRDWHEVQRMCNPDLAQETAPATDLTETERIMAKFVNVPDREVCELAGGLNMDASREAKRRGFGDAACRAIPKVAPPSPAAQARLKDLGRRDLCAGLAVGNPDYEYEARRRGLKSAACADPARTPQPVSVEPAIRDRWSQITTLTDQDVCVGLDSDVEPFISEARKRGLNSRICMYAKSDWQRVPARFRARGSDRSICAFALDRDGATARWDTSFGMLERVYEAKRRRFEIADCLRLTAR